MVYLLIGIAIVQCWQVKPKSLCLCRIYEFDFPILNFGLLVMSGNLKQTHTCFFFMNRNYTVSFLVVNLKSMNPQGNNLKSLEKEFRHYVLWVPRMYWFRAFGFYIASFGIPHPLEPLVNQLMIHYSFSLELIRQKMGEDFFDVGFQRMLCKSQRL